jgi:hypothetical protein
MYLARLSCGLDLSYEAESFAPGIGDLVPCPRHGQCPVNSRQKVDDRGSGRVRRAIEPRSQRELLDFLSRRPVTSVHALRRNRFTLRIVSAAQKDGLVDVNLLSGRVILRRLPSSEGSRQ